MVTAPSGEQNDDQDVTRIKDEPHSAPEEARPSLPVQYLLNDISKHLGTDLTGVLPPELLEAYCMATISRNEPTGKLLKALLENFLKAYTGPTPDEAMKAFDFLTYLSDPESHS
ncbi:hypothetical protein LCGC14_0170080 [marine sediment metagenome]|jgi:hypothetical protein|uniref:Uncharacterized protein n=1 Tax=marine sediment metagenome TaxID=412755 RepID=A0A0F9UWE0_9ZZZZ